MCLLLLILHHPFAIFFFFNDTATTEIYTLSLHDALPISLLCHVRGQCSFEEYAKTPKLLDFSARRRIVNRSEEHTSELQSPCNLVCRLLLEKKKKDKPQTATRT